jgi:hypothetical protein
LSVTTGNRYYPLIGVLLLGIVAYLTVGEQKDNWWGEGRGHLPHPFSLNNTKVLSQEKSQDP